MTDDHGDAALDADEANLDTSSADDPSDEALGGGTAPLANRIDAVQGTMSTIGMRIDALVTSTTSYRSALSDRLAEYADLVNKASRSQAADLEEYRRATERTVGEVRRAVSTMDEGLLRLATRIDELANERVGAEEGESRRVLSEVRSILDAQERLSDFLTSSLDQFGESVVGQLDASTASVNEGIASLREVIDRLGDSDRLSTLVADLAATRGAVDALAARDVAGPLRAELEASLQAVAADLQSAIGELAARDRSDAIQGELAQLRASLAGSDDSASIIDSLDQASTTLDLLARQITDRDEHARREHTEVLNTLVGVRNGLEALTVRDVAEPVRAELEPIADSLERLTQQVDAGVARLLDTSRLDESLAQLHEAVLDVASGEVVGALWDEFRGLRDSIEAATEAQRQGSAAERQAVVHDIATQIDRLVASMPEPEADPGIASLEAAVGDLTGEVRTLLAAAEVPDEDGGFADEVVLPDDVFEPITAALGDVRSDIEALRSELVASAPSSDTSEVREQLEALRSELVASAPSSETSEVREQLDALRAELADGLSVEPSPKLLDALALLHDDLIGLPDAVAALPEIQNGLEELRSAVAEAIQSTHAAVEAAQAAPTPSEAPPAAARADEAEDRDEWMAHDLEVDSEPTPEVAAGPAVIGAADLLAELHDLRRAIDQVQSRLDEGLVLDDSDVLAPSASDAVAVADEIAALRDLLAVEFDGLRAQLSEGPAPASSAAAEAETGTGEVFARIDPDTVDLLREEIRASGGVSDSVVEAIGKELKSLRRRLAVKADEKVLSDEQLDFIAEAVAKRLAK